MAVPYLEVYTKSETGENRGSYSSVYQRNAEIKSIQHSLDEGDRMVLVRILDDREDNIDYKRPIRFFAADGTKIFDGQIIKSKYVDIGSDYRHFETVANGWWHELSTMNIDPPIEYDDKSPDYMLKDIVRLANDLGMMKKALYVYDTSKIPGYTAHSSAYTANSGTIFRFSNIYDALHEITLFLDIAETDSTYEFGLRIEALPHPAWNGADEITQSDVDDNIYINPFILNFDTSTNSTFERFMLEPGCAVERDYRRLANDVFVYGDGYETQQTRTVVGQEATTQILQTTDITSSDQTFNPTNQPLQSHYLRVIIDNPSGVPTGGRIEITFEDGVDEIIDKFHMDLSTAPAGEHAVHVRYTSIRSHDGIKINGVRAVGFGGWTPFITITIDEITNPPPTPHHTTIAGKSINDYGHTPFSIENVWINTQERANYAAGKHCRLYHAPTHVLEARVMQRYIEFDNLVGCTADFYSIYEKQLKRFLVTDVFYSFEDNKINQHINAMRYEVKWNYGDEKIYVVVGSGNYVTVSGDKVVI